MLVIQKDCKEVLILCGESWQEQVMHKVDSEASIGVCWLGKHVLSIYLNFHCSQPDINLER